MSDSSERTSPTNIDDLKCGFCGKGHRQVEQLIAGPGGAAICDECVDLCNEILAGSRARGPRPPREPVIRLRIRNNVQ